MFISKDEIKQRMGVEVDAITLGTAQSIIEAYVGRVDEEVVDASDRSALGLAVAFQAVYINDNRLNILEQAAVDQMDVGSTQYKFNTELFAPFLAPLALLACRRVSWFGTRSVHTGPVFDSKHSSWVEHWERY